MILWWRTFYGLVKSIAQHCFRMHETFFVTIRFILEWINDLRFVYNGTMESSMLKTNVKIWLQSWGQEPIIKAAPGSSTKTKTCIGRAHALPTPLLYSGLQQNRTSRKEWQKHSGYASALHVCTKRGQYKQAHSEMYHWTTCWAKEAWEPSQREPWSCGSNSRLSKSIAIH